MAIKIIKILSHHRKNGKLLLTNKNCKKSINMMYGDKRTYKGQWNSKSKN